MIKPMRNWSNDRSPATAILKKIIKIQCGCHVRAQFGGRIEWTPPSHPQLIGLRGYISAMTTNTGRWTWMIFLGVKWCVYVIYPQTLIDREFFEGVRMWPTTWRGKDIWSYAVSAVCVFAYPLLPKRTKVLSAILDPCIFSFFLPPALT